MNAPHLLIPDAAWTRISSGNDDQRIRAVVILSGVAFSAEAIPINEHEDDGQQTAVCFVGHCRLVGLHREFGIAAFQSVVIAGRAHVLLIMPTAAETSEVDS